MADVELDTLGAVIKTAYEAEPDTNAFTDAEKTKLTGIEAGAQVNTVDSVAGQNGDVLLTADDIPDGTTAKQFTAEEKTRLAGIGSSDVTFFQPTGKFSPLKMTALDGWANGNYDTGPAATHDASAGAVPSFTTAKKRQICIVTVAGTLGGVAVLKGDLLMALQDNPTTAAHWSRITDSTTEFVAAVEAAKGSPVSLYGTYLLKDANPAAAVNLIGEYTILNQCGYSALYQTANNTRAELQIPRQIGSAGVGVATGIDLDDEIGTTLQHVSYFTLVNPAHAADFPLNKMVEVFTDAVHVSESGSSKGYVSNVFRVTSVDLVTGIVYADRVIKYQNKIANATNIYIIPLHEDRAVKIRKDGLFMGAPTIIGGEVGWWLTLDGSNPLAGTISGSGSSRTITYTGPNLEYLVNQGIRMGLVSGVPEISCKISAFSYAAGVNTITFAVTTKNDRGQTYAAPTSGTVYFVPTFWTSEFNTATHGRAVILQQAHGSDVDLKFARLWGGGCGIRFTHYSKVKVSCQKTVNIGTGISGKSWRLTYLAETYSSSRNDIEVENKGDEMGARHPYTTSSGTTSTAWASTHWILRSGCTCENKVKIYSKGDTGPAADTHSMTNGDEINSEVEFPTTYNTAHSYRGIGAQRRCENGISRHKQRGGQVGFRIAAGDYTREPGSIDYVDLEVHDLPLRAGAHAFAGDGSGNLPMGIVVQSQAAYTGGSAGSRTLTEGKLTFKNAACGFSFEANTTGRFTSIDHTDVGYALGWVQNAAKVSTKNMSADYSIAGGVEAVSSSSVLLGVGTKTFTIATGLTIDAGIDVLVQSALSLSASKANYGWGRVVSYNSGTGELVVYLEGIRGSGTIASWTITIGAKIPRYGVVLSGTGEFTFNTFNWRVGAGANPSEIFHSKDNTAGKVVNGGILIIDDPLLKGMPSIVTAGREADFTVKIGIIIYNGIVIMSGGVQTTGRAIGDAFAISARDVDGAADTPFITLTAGNTPTCNLDAAVTRAGAPIANAVDFQEFTADGTWKKPAWATATSTVHVIAVGGGGGGGGGSRTASGTGTGGGGGGSGSRVEWFFEAGKLDPTVSVTVGAAGTGGAGATVDANPGIAGTLGGNSSFGTLIKGWGGGGGGGGGVAVNSAGGGAGGALAAGTSAVGITPGAGGLGGGGNGVAGTSTPSTGSGTTGGAAGAGASTTVANGVAGGSNAFVGGGGGSGGSITSAPAAGIGGNGCRTHGYYTAAAGGAIGANGDNAEPVPGLITGVSGGAGGSNLAGNGGNAGAGAGYMAGGSGGGAARGGNGGAGADGRPGLVRVWTHA